MKKHILLTLLIIFQANLYSQTITVDSPSEIIKSSEIIELNDTIFNFDYVENIPTFTDCKSSNKEKTIKNTKNKIGKLAVSDYSKIGKNENFDKGIYRIITKFIIDKEGNIINIQVMFPNEKIRNEAFKKISEFPKFEPGVVNGNKVFVEYNLQIPFIIQ